MKLDDRGRPIQEEEDLELGDNCIIVPQTLPGTQATAPEPAAKDKKPAKRKRRK